MRLAGRKVIRGNDRHGERERRGGGIINRVRGLKVIGARIGS